MTTDLKPTGLPGDYKKPTWDDMVWGATKNLSIISPFRNPDGSINEKELTKGTGGCVDDVITGADRRGNYGC